MKNRLLLISFIVITSALIVGFILVRKHTDYQREMFLKPAIAKNDLVNIMRALLIYEQEQGSLPGENSISLLKNYQPISAVAYPDLATVDPWGNPYRLYVPGRENLPYTIVSFGADGKEGGMGKNADLDSNATFLKYKESLLINPPANQE